MPLRTPFLTCTVLLLLFPAPLPAGKSSTPFPYRLVVEIGRGKFGGSSVVRENLKRELVGAIDHAGCFLSVHGEAPDPPAADDLLLRLTVVDYEEETDFRFSLSQTNDPNLDRERRTTLAVRVDLAAEVLTLGHDQPVRARRFSQYSAWTPRPGEDPREIVRERIVAEVVRNTRSFVCKGSPSKWAKQLESARGNAAER